MLMPNIFMYSRNSSFNEEDLSILSRLIENHGDRKIEYASEVFDTIMRNKNDESIKEAITSIGALSYGVQDNKKLSTNRESKKLKSLNNEADDVEQRGSTVYEGSVLVFSESSGSELYSNTDLIETAEEVNNTLLDYELLKENFIEDYGVDLRVLLTNAFKGEETAIETLNKLKEENKDLKEILDELLALHRRSDCNFDFFNLEGGF